MGLMDRGPSGRLLASKLEEEALPLTRAAAGLHKS